MKNISCLYYLLIYIVFKGLYIVVVRGHVCLDDLTSYVDWNFFVSQFRQILSNLFICRVAVLFLSL